MKNILFDFLGTLTYLEPGDDFGLAIANLLGREKREYLTFVKKYWFKQNLLPEEFARIMINESGADPFNLEEIIKWINNPLGRIRLFPEATNVLENLNKSKNLYLVSDTSRLGRIAINNLGLVKYFSGIFLSCEIGKIKKEGLYEVVFNEINIKPKNCLVVGDSIESDYILPRKLGSKAILIDRNGRYKIHDKIQSLIELI